MAVVDAKRSYLRVLLSHLFLLLMLAVVFYPLINILSMSFRPGNFLVGPLIPDNPSLEHWRLVFGIVTEENADAVAAFPILTWTWNSFKVAFISSSITLLISASAAYAFARMRFAGSKWLLTALMIAGMFPAIAGVAAIRVMLEKVGAVVPALGFESHGGLILLYLGGVLGEIWLLKGYFETLDPALEEAATMDGANRWQVLRYIVLPLSLPMMAVVFILSFTGSFGEVAMASLLLNDPDKMTLALGMNQFRVQFSPLWGDFAASAIFAALPITALFLLGQRWLITGLTAGGVKG